MNIKIPKRFCDKMDEIFLVECKSVFSKYESFATGDMYFFPEYTDHSFKHIQYILNTADKLIPDNTMKYLNSIDIFILCLSILFHDLGMNLNLHSLKTLYKNNFKDELKNKDFQTLWGQFIKEKHKDEKDLFELSILEEAQFTIYKNIVSDFVRKQHPFIAQIIAEYGFPDKEGFISYNEKSKNYYYELSGIIARSHGMDLRVLIEYLKKKYGDLWKTPYACSAMYLMCIVRISDYLHITDDRINKYKLNLHNFENPISHDEYLKHRSVYHSQTIYDNPETIYVEIHPENCNIYLGMLDLLNDIQKELDLSWAIMGEVYGRTELSIAVRRITSNILSQDWENSSKYVSEKLSFYYDKRLMDLLIKPLYGNNASYAVRELIQNATDACKTRKAMEEEYAPQVEIEIKNGYFTITDNGIGMSLNVIRNHFLKIGSSFSDSQEYKLITKSDDDVGIQRNGKFGIGILSSFLLGDTIEVRTKSKDQVEYIFSTQKNTKIIEIEKNAKSNKKFSNGSDYGTEIKIKLTSNISTLSLIIKEWYKLDDVELKVNSGKEKDDKDNLIHISDLAEDKNQNEGNAQRWHYLDHCEKYQFKKIFWSYDYKINPIYFNGRDEEKSILLKPDLICNGILIPDTYSKRISSSIIESWPTVLIFDTMGVLDLNLSRDEINGNLPFIKELENVLIKDFAEEFMSLSESVKQTKKELPFDSYTLRYSKFKIQNYFPQKIVYTHKGYSLYNKYFMCKLKINKVVRIWTYSKTSINISDILHDSIGYILEGIGSHPNLKSEIINYRDNSINSIFFGGKIYLHKKDYEDYIAYAANVYRLSQKFISTANIGFIEDVNVEKDFGLKLNQNDISLIIEYQGDNLNNIIPIDDLESQSILSYFNNKVCFPYE